MSQHYLGPEHRQFSRVLFDAPARLYIDSQTWETQLIDVSLKGALVRIPPKWPTNVTGTCMLEIPLGEDIFIRMEVRVAHLEDKRIGFFCEHIDIDSMSNLRRLIELNLGSPELLNRELSALGHA